MKLNVVVSTHLAKPDELTVLISEYRAYGFLHSCG